MPQLLIALLVLWIVFYGVKMFANANPVVMARLVKRGGGGAALAMAAFLLVRGQIEVAMAVGGLGAWLLGWSAIPSLRGFRFPGLGTPRGGQASRVRSAMVEMSLDHDSGAMQGKVLSGAYAGRGLESLTRPECEALFATCVTDDPEGARLLETYLDRRFPGWRAASHGGDDARRGSVARRGDTMSEQEAYEILGLGQGSSREDITRAHRSLMMKLHPDRGGTTGLAARINEAKDVLLRQHG